MRRTRYAYSAAHMGVALDVDLFIAFRHPAGHLHIERHGERIARHQQLVECAGRLGLCAQIGRVERVRRDRWYCGRVGPPGVPETAAVAGALVLEKGESVVAP